MSANGLEKPNEEALRRGHNLSIRTVVTNRQYENEFPRTGSEYPQFESESHATDVPRNDGCSVSEAVVRRGGRYALSRIGERS